MRMLRLLVVSVVGLAFPLAACGGDDGGGGDDEAYDTFQACFDDHHVEEGFDVQDSIKICCIDHPIAGQDANVVCGESADACETFVTANLDTPDAVPDDVPTACADYIVERDQ